LIIKGLGVEFVPCPLKKLVPGARLDFRSELLDEAPTVPTDLRSQVRVEIEFSGRLDRLFYVGNHSPNTGSRFGLEDAADRKTSESSVQEFSMRRIVCIDDWKPGAHCFPRGKAKPFATAQVQVQVSVLTICTFCWPVKRAIGAKKEEP